MIAAMLYNVRTPIIKDFFENCVLLLRNMCCEVDKTLHRK